MALICTRPNAGPKACCVAHRRRGGVGGLGHDGASRCSSSGELTEGTDPGRIAHRAESSTDSLFRILVLQKRGKIEWQRKRCENPDVCAAGIPTGRAPEQRRWRGEQDSWDLPDEFARVPLSDRKDEHCEMNSHMGAREWLRQYVGGLE